MISDDSDKRYMLVKNSPQIEKKDVTLDDKICSHMEPTFDEHNDDDYDELQTNHSPMQGKKGNFKIYNSFF